MGLIQVSNTFYNEEYEDIRQWDELIKSPCFNKIVDKINLEKNRLQKDIDTLLKSPTLDNSIKITSLAVAKDKLNDLLLYFEFVKQKKTILDQRIVEKKMVVPSFNITKEKH